MVESVDDCIFTADTTGRLVTMNPAGRRLLGYEAWEVSRLRYPDLLAGEERGGGAPSWPRSRRAGAGAGR